jgi:hypothetical protein
MELPVLMVLTATLYKTLIQNSMLPYSTKRFPHDMTVVSTAIFQHKLMSEPSWPCDRMVVGFTTTNAISAHHNSLVKLYT